MRNPVHLIKQPVLRTPEIRLLLLGISIAVFALTAVQFFVSRVSQVMLQQAAQVLGGDLVLTATYPLSPAYLKTAQAKGLKTAELIQLTSMAIAGENLQLVQIQAVSPTYPLLGTIETSPDLTTPAQAATTLPQTGEAWAEARVFVSLGIQPGATIQLGQQSFRLTQVLRKTPDQNLNLFQFAPRILMPQADLAATQLLGPASRAQFSHLFTGSPAAVQNFRTWLQPQLKPSERIRNLDDNIQAIQQTVTRGQRFLLMASLLTVLLAAAAITLTCAQWLRAETRTVAILKTLGARQSTLIRHYGRLGLGLTTVGGLIGTLSGYLIHLGFAALAQKNLHLELPPAALHPWFSGLLTAWLIGLGLLLPYGIRLLKTPPQILFQQTALKTPYTPGSRLGTALLLLTGIGMIIWLALQSFWISVAFLIGLALLLSLIAILAQVVLALTARLAARFQHATVLIIRLVRRSQLLIPVFGISLFSLLLLSTLSHTLLQQWQDNIPPQAPDHFIINIQPPERQPLKTWLQQQGFGELRFYPVVRGRLTHINAQPVSQRPQDDPRVEGLLNRTFNLSATYSLPTDNKITAGQWFPASATTGLSVEASIMERLGLTLGDSLTFELAGQTMTAPIQSIRQVRWDTLQPNFFVLAAPPLLQNLPQTDITSLYIGEQTDRLKPLMRQFPALTIIDSRNILTQVRDLISQASRAIQLIFFFSLAAGITVLFALVQSQRITRYQEIALLKTLGASGWTLKKIIFLEFAWLGGLAGLLAGFLVVLTRNFIADYWLDLPWVFDLTPLLVGSLSGAIGVGLSGYWSLHRSLGTPPVILLTTPTV